ncbi:MAG: 30S ribosomal protein S12 methylthiotransferase RimO, partial [Lachnospiraceae bacterium]|nr:30S ribosomal protein S12 methylthiotransferase RimO [Lachnospiraceae bacterium]
VDEKTKNERKRIILNEQKKIVKEINKAKVNKVYYSIVEGKVGENKYLVRPYFNARNIDDKVYALTNEELISGTFVNVEIKKVKGYDLEGVIV